MRGTGAALLLAGLLVGSRGAHTQPRGTPPEIVREAIVDPSKEINFASGVWPSRVYVGQQATYQIGIFLSDAMRSRLRSNPQFVPPDVRSVISHDLPVPGRLFSREEGGTRWDVHVYARAMFPVTPGMIDVAPARLTWQVPLSNSIFSREESHSARSASHRITVREPPRDGRPAGYAGAVGQLSLRVQADAAPKRVGDPFVLTVTVSGVGNVGLFPRPDLALPWGHAVTGPERVSVDSSSTLVRGDKRFEWVVTPRVPGTQEVPALRYPYFNPYLERYEVAVTSPQPVRVVDGALVATADADSAAADRPALRRTLRPDTGAPWSSTSWFWLGVALAPLPVVARGWRRRARPAAVIPAKSQLERWARVAVPDPVEVRRAAREALEHRVPGVRSAMARGGRDLERVLRRAGVTAGTTRDAVRLVEELDLALYGGIAHPTSDLASRALTIVRRVDDEAVARAPGGHRAGRVLAWLVLVGTASLTAQRADDAGAFAEALAAWDRSDIDGAHAGFAAVSARRPRAADAWMNLGTVAWERGDTATAVAGWQRALRLEPLAPDARARLLLTPGFRDGLLGDIPPVPVNALATFALLAWWSGWLLWLRARRPGTASRAALGLAATAALGALASHERLVGRAAIVFTVRDQLRDAPVLAGTPGPTVDVGETARIVASQGAWHRVRLADEREGWLDASRTMSLEVPASR